MNFEFATATQIVFGPGSAARIPELVSETGSRVFLVTGGGRDRYSAFADSLQANGCSVQWYSVAHEPDTGTVSEALEAAREHNADAVVAIGGGSVLDTGKVVAALLTNPGDLHDYLEVVGKGKKIEHTAAPFLACPTTAGTGTEVTRNAVISVPEHRVKVSVRSPLMLPRYALVDPELTVSSPAGVTAASGLDALTQLIESYTGIKANPLTDGICREGMMRAGRSLRTAYLEPGNREAREDMSIAALFSGLGLANAKLGGVHGFAGPLGGLIGAAHGALCARLLAPVTRANMNALSTREPESESLARYDDAARLVTGNREARSHELLEWIQETADLLEIPSLGELGLTRDIIPEAVEKSRRSSSMKGNAIELSEAELSSILEEAM